MCGIVGVACSGPMTVPLKELFQNLLYHDVVRGHHATGIAAVDTNNKGISVVKAALPASEFLQQPEPQELFAHKHNYNIYLGHNRFATSGSKSEDANAHPFQWGHIVGVHNGSLRNQSLLDDHKDFEVDSSNIFWHMAIHGLDDTISKLNGAYSLVWYDSQENSLNFIRNSERPMVIARLTGGATVWASEMGMLRWLIKRHKFLRFDTIKGDDGKTDEDFCYSLTEGHHFSIKFDGRNIKKSHLVKKTLPTFPVQTVMNYGNFGSWRSDKEDWSGKRTGANSHVDRLIGKLTDRVKIDKYLQVKLIEIYEEENYFPATQKTTMSRRLKFEYRPYGDKVDSMVLYCSGVGQDALAVDIEDIGSLFYVKVYHAFESKGEQWSKVSNAVPGAASNESGVVITCGNISSIPPNGYILYNNSVRNKREDQEVTPPSSDIPFDDDNPDDIDTGDEDNDVDGNTLEVEDLEKKDQARSKTKGGNSGSSAITTEENRGTGLLLTLGNCRLSRNRMIDVSKENNYRCSNCDKNMKDVKIGLMYVISEVEKGGDVRHYMSCGKKCYHEMKTWVKGCGSSCIDGYVNHDNRA